jgi:16S rRNA (cytidine(1402)-2'-O)-methyltransferase
MPGKLSVVPTPIGNLGDITQRAIDTLRAADVVFCEDTRRSGLLLHRLGIERPLRSLFVGNERERSEEALALIASGQHVALISDAGTPAISDPGAGLIADAITAGCALEVLPGPQAILPALLLSGLPPAPFSFVGFLPRRGAERKAALLEISALPWTLVLYEAPHRLHALLADAASVLGDRPAAVVREIYDAFLREGNLEAIARRLDARGVAAPGGRGWSAQRLRYILMNPTYAGLRTWQRHARPKDGRGAYRRQSRERWLVVEGQGPPAIVPIETWDRAYRALDRPAHHAARRGSGEHPLTGVLVCATCGSAMSGRLVRRGDRTYRYYRCPGHYRQGTCARGQVRADELEGLVRAAIRARFAEGALLERAVLETPGTEAGAERQRLVQALDAVRGRIRRWEDAYEDASIDARTLSRRLADLRAEELALRARLMQASPSDRGRPPLPVDGWTAMTPTERGAFVRDLVARVSVHRNGTVEVVWNGLPA